jgi:hypothetical protein
MKGKAHLVRCPENSIDHNTVTALQGCCVVDGAPWKESFRNQTEVRRYDGLATVALIKHVHLTRRVGEYRTCSTELQWAFSGPANLSYELARGSVYLLASYVPDPVPAKAIPRHPLAFLMVARTVRITDDHHL